MIVDPKVLQTIPNSENHNCFGCGSNNPNGLKMKFHTDGERVYSFIRASSNMTGWDRTVHGGILTTILDEILGWGVVYLLKKIGMTKSIKVEFNKAVYAGERLTVVGGILVQRSDRESVMQGAIYNEKDTLCVGATGQFTTMRPKAALRLGLVGSDYMETFGPILGFSYDGG